MLDKEFIYAGKATFTFANPDGVRYTYKVSYSKKIDRYFAYLLTGPNNRTDYTYMGMVVGKTPSFVLTRKSKLTEESFSIKVFHYALAIINGYKKLEDGYFLEHDGTCGRCSRKLTTPESIKSGLGPICRNK